MKEPTKPVNDDVLVESDSASKIEEGLERTLKMAEEKKKKFEEKKETATKSFMCNSCGFKSKTEQGIKRHISTSKTCKKEKGYREVSNVEINEEDRKLGEDTIAKAVVAAKKATEEIREIAKEEKAGKKYTVVDLMRCPTVMLEKMLSETDTSEIKKFLSVRIHPSNASRKVFAEKELEKRS